MKTVIFPSQKSKDCPHLLRNCHASIVIKDDQLQGLSLGALYKGSEACGTFLADDSTATEVATADTSKFEYYYTHALSAKLRLRPLLLQEIDRLQNPTDSDSEIESQPTKNHKTQMKKLKKWVKEANKDKHCRKYTKIQRYQHALRQLRTELQEENERNKKNKLEVVSGEEVREILMRQCPELKEILDLFRSVAVILQLSMAHEIPALFGPCVQYMQHSLLDCAEYLDCDILRYFKKHKVNPHVDHVNLVQKNMPYFGLYVVIKIGADHNKPFQGCKQCLCHMSDKGNDCCWTKCLPNEAHFGRHISLKCGTIYFLSCKGA